MSATSRFLPPQLIQPIEQWKAQLKTFLYDGNKSGDQVVKTFDVIEQKTSIKREHLVYGIGGLLAVYLVIGGLAQLICNLIGFAYPAYASVKAIRTATTTDDKQWLMYWTVFALFSVCDSFADSIMRYMPAYYLLKVMFLLYLALPYTKGAQQLYEKVVDPLITQLDHHLAQYNIRVPVSKDD